MNRTTVSFTKETKQKLLELALAEATKVKKQVSTTKMLTILINNAYKKLKK